MNKRKGLLEYICLRKTPDYKKIMDYCNKYFADSDLETGGNRSKVFYDLFISLEPMSYEAVAIRNNFCVTTIEDYVKKFNLFVARLITRDFPDLVYSITTLIPEQSLKEEYMSIYEE